MSRARPWATASATAWRTLSRTKNAPIVHPLLPFVERSRVYLIFDEIITVILELFATPGILVGPTIRK